MTDTIKNETTPSTVDKTLNASAVEKPYDVAVIHYAEIGLKGGNRRRFERLLMKNIKSKVSKMVSRFHRETGQISATLSDGFIEADFCDAVKRVPGVAYFSLAKCVSSEFESLKNSVLAFASEREFTTFKIDTKRRNKTYPMEAMEVNRQMGGVILYGLEDKKVQMKDNDLMLRIEITGEKAYLSANKIKGVGGLPTDPAQRMVALLSGGLDSPVAAYMMMKRGCEVILTHYKNENQMSGAVEDKIIQLAKQLAKYQVRTKLYIVPFEEIQKEIVMKVKADQRMLVYRRVMLNLSARIAERHKIEFLIVGDSFSQVASQTYENLAETYAQCPKHILSPLMGLDKVDITKISTEINTYEISALPYGDCCSFFLPKHPELRVKEGMLDAHVAKFDLDVMGEAAIDAADIKIY